MPSSFWRWRFFLHLECSYKIQDIVGYWKYNYRWQNSQHVAWYLLNILCLMYVIRLTPQYTPFKYKWRSRICNWMRPTCCSLRHLHHQCPQKIELRVKYGEQLGLNYLNGFLFECNHKVLEGFLSFKRQYVLYYMIKNLIFYVVYVRIHLKLLSPLVYSSNKIKIKKELKHFSKF